MRKNILMLALALVVIAAVIVLWGRKNAPVLDVNIGGTDSVESVQGGPNSIERVQYCQDFLSRITFETDEETQAFLSDCVALGAEPVQEAQEIFSEEASVVEVESGGLGGK